MWNALAVDVYKRQVDDRASNALRDIRRDLLLLEEKIKDKAEALLKSQKKFMAESFLVTRNGPVSYTHLHRPDCIRPFDGLLSV